MPMTPPFAVSIGQRVSALAQPGEILVSSTVKDLVAGSAIAFRTSSTDSGVSLMAISLI